MHGIVTQAGAAPNAIPERAEGRWYVRAASLAELDRLEPRVRACFQAGALAAGCELTIKPESPRYAQFRNDAQLLGPFTANARDLGRPFASQDPDPDVGARMNRASRLPRPRAGPRGTSIVLPLQGSAGRRGGRVHAAPAGVFRRGRRVRQHHRRGGAAARVHLSQSAMSAALADLERALDVQLLLRHHARGVTRTAAGEQLLAASRRLLAQADELKSEAHGLGYGLAGTLPIGCFGVLAPYALPELIATCADRYPQLRLATHEVDLDALAEGVLSGRFELGLGYELAPDPRLAVDRG